MAFCIDKGKNFSLSDLPEFMRQYRKPVVFCCIVVVIVSVLVFSIYDMQCKKDYSSDEMLFLTIEDAPVVMVNSDETDCPGEEGFAGSVDIYVHVAGAVKNPGVYVLKEGMRIQDALFMAEPDVTADVHSLNLAAAVYDGQKIVVPFMADEGSVTDVVSNNTSVRSYNSGKININTADLTILMSLPGIGETKGKGIIDYREENGYFHSISDIQKVDGIGIATYEKLKDKIEV